jgi:hypothetical protein
MRAAVFLWLFLFLAASGARATPGDTLVTLERMVDLYDAPETARAPIAMLEQGQKLMEFERRGGWVRVGVFGTLGQEGWVRASAVGPPLPAEEDDSPASPADKDEQGEVESLDDYERAMTFLIDVSGTPALSFRALCRIVTPNGETIQRELEGWVPKQYRVGAQAVSCVIQKRDAQGRLRARLYLDDRALAVASTRASFNWVRVRSDGPWGQAGGIVGDLGIIGEVPNFPKEESPRPLVPPLSGNPVPPLSGNPVPPLSGNPVPSLSTNPQSRAN